MTMMTTSAKSNVTQSQSSHSKPKIGAPEPIAALNRVRILEYAHPFAEREPLVDVRIYCPDVVFSEHICPYLRKTVADKVNQAQASLPSGYKLRAGSAMRTLAMQKHGWDNYHKRLREEHPQWPLSALRRATNKYFAPYDQKAPPGHCTGGAIDVGLLDADGNAMDLTSPTEGWQAAYTWSDLLSPEAKSNRMIMVEAMLGAGFSNCRDEFWHYSYGDSAWAVRVGERECPYGWTYPPVALEANFPNGSASDLHIDFERAANGSVLRASGGFSVPDDAPRTPDGLPFFAAGLFWASSVPVTLHLTLPDANAPAFPIFAGPQRDKPDEWRELEISDRANNVITLVLTPDSDRLYLSNAIPVAPESANQTEAETQTEIHAEDEPGDAESDLAKPDA